MGQKFFVVIRERIVGTDIAHRTVRITFKPEVSVVCTFEQIAPERYWNFIASALHADVSAPPEGTYAATAYAAEEFSLDLVHVWSPELEFADDQFKIAGGRTFRADLGIRIEPMYFVCEKMMQVRIHLLHILALRHPCGIKFFSLGLLEAIVWNLCEILVGSSPFTVQLVGAAVVKFQELHEILIAGRTISGIVIESIFIAEIVDYRAIAF